MLEKEDLEIKLELLKIQTYSALNMEMAFQIHKVTNTLDRSQVFSNDEFYDGRDLQVDATSPMLSQRKSYLASLQNNLEQARTSESVGIVAYTCQLYKSHKY